MKSWQSIKEDIYFEDGSLRDINIYNTDKDDWKKWSELVNRRFEVEFTNGFTLSTSNRIDIEEVFRYWKNPEAALGPFMASVKLKDLKVNCYFFEESVLENDIDPREVKNEKDHILILEYLHVVAAELKKKIVMTLENTEELILLEL